MLLVFFLNRSFDFPLPQMKFCCSDRTSGLILLVEVVMFMAERHVNRFWNRSTWVRVIPGQITNQDVPKQEFELLRKKTAEIHVREDSTEKHPLPTVTRHCFQPSRLENVSEYELIVFVSIFCLQCKVIAFIVIIGRKRLEE